MSACRRSAGRLFLSFRPAAAKHLRSYHNIRPWCGRTCSWRRPSSESTDVWWPDRRGLPPVQLCCWYGIDCKCFISLVIILLLVRSQCQLNHIQLIIC